MHFDLTPAHIQEALELARFASVRTVLAAVGDGTTGSVAQHVIGSEFVLGVLPAGTSNDCAPRAFITSSDVRSA